MSGETITTNETTGGMKGVKLARFSLIPFKALRQVWRAHQFHDEHMAELTNAQILDVMDSAAELWWAGQDTDGVGNPLMANVALCAFELYEQRVKSLHGDDNIPTPSALWALAELYGIGARKYAARNWEKGYEWSKSFDALCRHKHLPRMGQEYDMHTDKCTPDCKEHTEVHHFISVAWHALALLTFAETHPELDDRPKVRP